MLVGSGAKTIEVPGGAYARYPPSVTNVGSGGVSTAGIQRGTSGTSATASAPAVAILSMVPVDSSRAPASASARSAPSASSPAVTGTTTSASRVGTTASKIGNSASQRHGPGTPVGLPFSTISGPSE